LKWNQKDASFENILKLTWSKTQHTIYYMQSFDYFAFWKEKLTWCKMKTIVFCYFMVFCVNFNLSFWIYYSMVHDKVTLSWFQQQEVWVKTRGFIKINYLFWATILSACIITINLVREAMTFIEKLFTFWERHLLVQIAFLI
jgi:hypothetical protein